MIAGNWIVTLLERAGASAAAAGVLGGLVLLAGIVTRPVGGALARRAGPGRRQMVAGSLVAASAGAFLLAAGGPLWVSGLGALALGLAAGLPFAAIFDAAQRTRPDAPGAAVALVNGCAVLTILVGTPLAGLAFDLPGDGAVAFAAIGASRACPSRVRLPFRSPPSPPRRRVARLRGVPAVLDFAFGPIGLHRVIGRLEQRNVGSVRVLEKLGMRREAHLVENEWVKGEWQSELVYAILAREWGDGSAGKRRADGGY